MSKIAELEALGFSAVAGKLKKAEEFKRKMAVAYEHFRYVRQEKVDAFNAKLKEKTKKGEELYNATWQTLGFTSVEDYDKVPPDHVLTKMAEAQNLKCFDSYEVAYIKEVKDPILFGRIESCPDRFFIDQWDDDVKIDDILNSNEG